MSWKPCRGSGIMFDKATRQADKARRELNELLPNCNPPKMGELNKLSRLYYSYWLNDNKARKSLGAKWENSFTAYVPEYYLRIFKNYQNEIYKPVQNLLEV